METKKYLLWSFLVLLSFVHISAQNEINISSINNYHFQKGAYEKINKVIAVTNGKIVAVGEAFGKGNYDRDGLFLILDPQDLNTPIVRKTFGKPDRDDVFNSVIQNHNGTFTMVGYSSTGKKGNSDGWIVSVDLEGNLIDQSQHKENPDLEEEIKDIAINHKGDIMAIGRYYDKKGRRSVNWILQLIEESWEYGFLTDETIELAAAESIVADTDGNFLIVGNTRKSSSIPKQIWAVKLDPAGEDVWGKTNFYGEQKEVQSAYDVAHTRFDNGFIISGSTTKNASGPNDMLLLKINDKGEEVWSKNYAGKRGEDTDVAQAVIHLSEGGYAMIGQTRSHLPKADRSTLFIVITDEQGNQLDAYTTFVMDGQGDEIAQDLVELFSGEEFIIAGSANHKNLNEFPAGHLELLGYKTRPFGQSRISDTLFLGDSNKALEIYSTTFTDQNGDGILSQGEPGYFSLQVHNGSKANLNHLKAFIPPGNLDNGLSYWETVEVGTIRFGESKWVHIPVQAEQEIFSIADLTIDLLEEDRIKTSSSLNFGSTDQPQPAKLVVSNYTVYPNRVIRAGDSPRLSVEITNTGALPSKSTVAYFSFPSGVQATEGTNTIRLPAILGKQSHTIAVNFNVNTNIDQSILPITLVCDEMPSLNKEINVRAEPSKQTASKASTTTTADGTQVYWVSPRPGTREVTVNNRDVNITAMTVSNRELAKNQFAVFINGKKTAGQKMDKVKLGPPEKSGNELINQVYENTLRLKEGKNVIKVVCYDENNKEIEGESKTTVFNFIPKDKPNLYVISIGVNHKDLEFTTKDSKDFAAYYDKLKRNKRLFGKVEVFSLAEELETTAFNIKAAFIDFSNRTFKDNDLFVVFISSHGKVNSKDEFLLLPSDYNPDYEELSSINFKTDILKKLRLIDGKKLVFLDACHSGSAGAKFYSDKATSKMVQDLIQSTSGMEIFASCSDDEFSYEDKAWENGAFTEAIIEAFENKKVKIGNETIQADIFKDDPITGTRVSGSDGVITIEELKTFVGRRVPYLVRSIKNESQHPINKQSELLPDNMGIYIIEN